jgi:hypothetical protein
MTILRQWLGDLIERQIEERFIEGAGALVSPMPKLMR